MFERPAKEINAEFMAEERFLDSIQRIVRESCVIAGLSKKITSTVQLAIEEGATNIIRHAYLYKKGTIRLRIVIYKKQIVFSLIDTGKSFNPEGTSSLNLERLVETGRKGGLGFYMIKKIMDSVEYISVGGYNELRMIKRITSVTTHTRPILRRLFSLRVKFSFWTSFVMALIIGGSFYFISLRTYDRINAHLHDTVKTLTETIAYQSSGLILNQRSGVEFDQMMVSFLRASSEFRQVVLTDARGLILANSEDVSNIREQYIAPTAYEVGKYASFIENNEKMYFLSIKILSGSQVFGNVNVVYSDENISSKIENAQQEVIFLMLFLSMVGIVAIYFLSNYFVTPIARITHRVKRFTSGELETEMPLERAEEFFEISKAFNQMMTRLSRDQKNIISREKLAKEIEVASQIQKTLLPGKLPEIENLQVDAFYRAASLIGGDLYDVIEVMPGRYCLVIADVSGKGVPASMVMSMLRTIIRIYSSEAKSSKEILVRVNYYLEENIPPGMFVTVMLIIYDSKSKKINLVSAGHNPLLYFNAEAGEVIKINPSGMPLGISSTLNSTFEDKLEEVSMTVKDNDLLFLYTDGITEAKDTSGNVYGMEKLNEFISSLATSNPILTVQEMTKKISQELDQFAGYEEQNDDITFVIARHGIPAKIKNVPLEGKNHVKLETKELKVKNNTTKKES